MCVPQRVLDDVVVLASSQRAPGHGVLPVNAFLLTGDAPVLVDTGLEAERAEFLDVLWGLVHPEDLAAVFVTHEDADHAGNLLPVLEAAPRARLVTNYVTVGKLLERVALPLDRVHVVNEGDRIPGTDRPLVVLRPPLYDAPGTFGVHDASNGVVLTVDAFGTYLPALVPDLDEVPDDVAFEGLADFNRVNHPWVTEVDHERFAAGSTRSPPCSRRCCSAHTASRRAGGRGSCSEPSARCRRWRRTTCPTSRCSRPGRLSCRNDVAAAGDDPCEALRLD